MNPEGTWDLSIATPIGKIQAVVDLHTQAGTWLGRAHGTGEEIPLRDIDVNENRLTWKQSITKPLRLNLTFDVTLDGDTMTGTSKAGRLPSTKVTGRRRPH
ncbi:hypothetical protein JOF56_010799 [Kibdelosporangium banguiense]|uniref:Uncharacterized protein n=1 Tax=Kibdelosporangium banguiense TaxID=1365924 RepID=A0ABS4U2H2_9PSEU|nr:hypothetical protein [Kibdelosporangium banguiense]MBP2330414.1 hypothetical protein [Kibdelosporangium banguiense]